MSQFCIPDPENLVICPYDEVHVVSHKRMQYHLVKCRKNHDISEKATCPFNRRHEVPKLELRYHMMICSDKVFIESEFFETEENNFHGDLSSPPYEVEQFVIKPKELWESESHVLSELKSDELQEFRNLTGLKPAERRQYKVKLREKFVKEQNGVDGAKLPEDKNEVDQTVSGLQPLRRPNTFSVSEQMHPLPVIGRGRGCFQYSPDVISTMHNGTEQAKSHLQNGFTSEDQKPIMTIGRGGGIGRGITSFLSNTEKLTPFTGASFKNFNNPQISAYDYEFNPNFQNRRPLAPGEVADIDMQKDDVLEEFCNLEIK